MFQLTKFTKNRNLHNKNDCTCISTLFVQLRLLKHPLNFRQTSEYIFCTEWIMQILYHITYVGYKGIPSWPLEEGFKRRCSYTVDI